MKLISIICVLAAALTVAELGFRASRLRNGLAAEDTFTAMTRHFAAFRKNPSVVVIGDSRTAHSVDTAVIEKLVKRHARKAITAWNLGRGGVIGPSTLAFALRVLDRPRLPRLVILYVDPNGYVLETPPDLEHKTLSKVWRLEDLPSVVRAGASAEELFQICVCASLDTMRFRERALEVLLHGRPLREPEGAYRNGFRSIRHMDGERQRSETASRGRFYRETYDGPSSGFRLSDFKLGSLREAVRRLREAGIAVAIVNAPEATSLHSIGEGRGTIVPRYLRAMKAIADEANVPFFDHSTQPVVSDDNFADGEHMDHLGAARYSTWLTHEIVLPMAYGVRKTFDRWDPPRPSAGCEVVFDFEEVALSGWESRGDAFAEILAGGRRGMQKAVAGFQGLGLLSSWHRRRGPRATGEAWSPPFTIERKNLRLLVGGGAKGVSVDLTVDGATVRSAAGGGGDTLAKRTWDVSELRGRQARLRVVDASEEVSGYVLLDQVEQCD